MKVISLQDYATLIGYEGSNPTLEEIQDYATDELDETIWDYPMDELDYVETEVQISFVFVQVDDVVRICETI